MRVGERVKTRTIHLVEIGDLVDIANIDDGEALKLVGNLVEDFVLAHAVGVPVAAEADDDEALFFGEDGLVDVPAGGEMGDCDGAHGCGCGGCGVVGRRNEKGFKVGGLQLLPWWGRGDFFKASLVAAVCHVPGTARAYLCQSCLQDKNKTKQKQ